MAKTNIHDVEPSRLAGLLRMPDEHEESWRPEDLEEVLRQQLTAPIEYDLISLRGGADRRLATAAAAKGLLVKSIRDLLTHANPPIELLRMTKEFAKAAREQPESPVPQEIATVMYFASIAAAWTRCGERIAELDNRALREGFKWVSQQSWVDEGTRSLVEEALQLLPV